MGLLDTVRGRLRSPRHQAAGGTLNATTVAIDRLVGDAVGLNPSAELTSAIGLGATAWGRALEGATIETDDAELSALLGVIGHRLAIEGEICLILRDGLWIMTNIASVKGAGSHPAGWRYQLTVPGPDATSRIENRSGDDVLHIRLPSATPWRGEPPWRKLKLASEALAEIENQLRLSSRRLPQSAVIFGGPRSGLNNQTQFESMARALFPTAPQRTPSVASGDAKLLEVAAGGLPAPARKEVFDAIITAYGLTPAFFSETASDTTVREVMRIFTQHTIAPIARSIQSEVLRVTGEDILIRLDHLHAPDWQILSRALERLVAAGIPLAEARKILSI